MAAKQVSDKHNEAENIIKPPRTNTHSAFKNPDFQFCATHIRYTFEHLSKPHYHDFPQVFFCVCGKYNHIADNKEYHCEPGSLLIVPQGVVHSFEVKNDGETVELIRIEASFTFLDNLGASRKTNMLALLFCLKLSEVFKHGGSFNRTLSGEEYDKALAIFLELCKSDDSSAAAVGLVRRQLDALFSLPSLSLPKDVEKRAECYYHSTLKPIMEVVSYLNLHFSEKIHSDELAHRANMSRSRFFLNFRNVLGSTYTNYLSTLRLAQVRFLLEYSSHSCSFIASACGFHDTAHMRKQLEEFCGMSPREYRQKMRKKDYSTVDYLKSHPTYESLLSLYTRPESK